MMPKLHKHYLLNNKDSRSFVVYQIINNHNNKDEPSGGGGLLKNGGLLFDVHMSEALEGR